MLLDLPNIARVILVQTGCRSGTLSQCGGSTSRYVECPKLPDDSYTASL